MAKVDYTDAELDAAAREMKASTRPATEGFVGKLLLLFARDTGASVKAALAKRLDPLQERVAELRQRDVEHGAKLDEHGVKLESLERRASRHAQHLATIEDRIRKLEGK